MKYGLKIQDSGSRFPDPNTRSGMFTRSECSSTIPSFMMKCYGDRSNTGLKSFTASVLYIITSDCRQIILIQRRCHGDRVWVSVVAWINGNKAVSLTACAVIGLILCGFLQPLIGWISRPVSDPMEAGSCSAVRHQQQRSRVALLRRDSPAGSPRACTDVHPDTCM